MTLPREVGDQMNDKWQSLTEFGAVEDEDIELPPGVYLVEETFKLSPGQVIRGIPKATA